MAMISIVVPVYNVEKYINNCINSILKQTYKDFELILVDDGSDDDCPQICDMYAQKDNRISVIHKKNGGLSDARNAGTIVAKGKFITYIDSDDYVNPLYLEMLLYAIDKTGADFSIVDLKKVYSLDNYSMMNKNDIGIRKMSAHEALSLVLYQKFHDVSASGILLPVNLAKKFKFPIGKLFEDLFTTYNYYLNADTVALVDAKLYYYLQRSNSIMDDNISHKYINDMLEASDNIVKVCRNSPDLLMAAENKRFSNYCSLAKRKKGIPKNDMEKIELYLNNTKFFIMKDFNARLKNRIIAVVLCLNYSLMRWICFFEMLLKKRIDL